ncbi:toxin secretion/phage lysis holin [Paenibacillus phyllosphaerae]|uniref:Toxin secretion/phage lysis holin n=1 Tax=Paenibacillus phyllosphaerae TaxID=274593 RepID=A0A7W5FM82_9BACL|nr:phage holin family protein [Paenibacillus phyllosphaerae]MBB3109828.1 toxin secretion/phage lysis holin [Paenibacillus phyllosphaerae]
MPNWLFCTVFAAGGVIESFAFGMWEESLTLLLVAMAVDYITGVTAAIRGKEGLNSTIGAWGLARKGLIFLVILLAHRIDIVLGTNNVAMSGTVYFYLANELISILENLGKAGVPIPPRLRGIINKLRDKSS